MKTWQLSRILSKLPNVKVNVIIDGITYPLAQAFRLKNNEIFLLVQTSANGKRLKLMDDD